MKYGFFLCGVILTWEYSEFRNLFSLLSLNKSGESNLNDRYHVGENRIPPNLGNVTSIMLHVLQVKGIQGG